MIIIECETMCRMSNVIPCVQSLLRQFITPFIRTVAMERTNDKLLRGRINCARVHLFIFDNVIEYSLTCSTTYELIIHLFSSIFIDHPSICLKRC